MPFLEFGAPLRELREELSRGYLLPPEGGRQEIIGGI